MNIPSNNVATCLVKWKRKDLCKGAFAKGLHQFKAKRLPNHREDLSLLPDFSGQAAAILAYGF
jgi:hypothetical protein